MASILFAVLAFGMIATALGPRIVFIMAPPVIVAMVVWGIRVCFRVSAQDAPEARDILGILLDTSHTKSG